MAQQEQQTAAAIADHIKEFLQGYYIRVSGQKVYKYFVAIEQMRTLDQTFIEVDIDDLHKWADVHDKRYLSYLLLNRTDEMLEYMKDAMLATLREIQPDYWNQIQGRAGVRIVNVEHMAMRIANISAAEASKLTVIKGRIAGMDDPMDVLVRRGYRCKNCNREESAPEAMKMKKKCAGCGEENALKLDHTASKFQRQQYLKVSQNNDMSMGSEILVDVRDDLVEKFKLGDQVLVSGVTDLMEVDPKKLPSAAQERVMVKAYIRANVIQYIEEHHLNIALTDDIIKQRLQWARNLDMEDEQGVHKLTLALVSSYAPNIHGQDVMKELILLLIASGGWMTELVDGGRERKWVNAIIVGDFGEGKTSVVMPLIELVDAIYQSLEGVSEVGLGAAVITDPLLKRKVVGAGMGVTGNKKIKVLDQAHTAKDESIFNNLDTMMENGFYPLSKAGMPPQMLDAAGSWILIANPKTKYYDKNKAFTAQVSIPWSVLSRCDILLGIQRNTDKTERQKRMDSMYSRYTGQAKSTPVKYLDLGVHLRMAMMIETAAFEPGVKEMLDAYYHKLADLDESKYGEIVVTLRQYGGLLRLAEARAKLCLRRTINMRDGKRIIALLDYMLQSIGIDIVHGKTGMGSIGDQPASVVGVMQIISELLRTQGAMQETLIISKLTTDYEITYDKIGPAWKRMKEKGVVYHKGDSVYELANQMPTSSSTSQ